MGISANTGQETAQSIALADINGVQIAPQGTMIRVGIPPVNIKKKPVLMAVVMLKDVDTELLLSTFPGPRRDKEIGMRPTPPRLMRGRQLIMASSEIYIS